MHQPNLQQGDVQLTQTNDDGDITITLGIVTMSGGLETAAYLSLFGGNEDDDGRDNNAFSWWGNLDETQPERQYQSETQNLLESIPATSSNLRRIEDAAKRDLAWFVDVGAASSVSVLVSIPALNRIKITVNIEALGEESQFEFTENWRASV